MNKKFYANPILVISLMIALAMAATEVALWISLLSAAMIFWKFLAEKKILPDLPKILPPLFGLIIFITVYIQYRTIWGQEESTTILLGLASLTIVNFSSDRDHQFLVLLGFILVMIKAVFSIDLIWIFPSLIAFMGLWLSLLTINIRNKYKYLFWHCLKSIPILVLLFFIFPRVVLFQSNQLQQQQQQSSGTGFSDQLNPGQISDLISQNQLAFRAEFFNQTPMLMDQLYWRGSVLTLSKNLEWRKNPNDLPTPNEKQLLNGPRVEYKIILEPVTHKNIFTLDSPTRITESNINVEQWDQNVFRAINFEQKQIHYTATSLRKNNFAVDDDEIESDTFLKIDPLPEKSKLWVDKINSTFKTQEQKLSALKALFSDPKFIYTLNPGKYEKNNMDEFLFSRRKGFCEHYAAAFATLARALGIPSRVVLGYQGGTYNLSGDFWKIAQKDAHAWTELAINNQWQRWDPTMWVSPLRITLGGEKFFSLSEDDQFLFSHSPNYKQDGFYTEYWDNLTALFENLNYKWTLFLLNFDKQTQLNFLKEFAGKWPVTAILFIIIVGLTTYFSKRKVSYKNKQLSPISNLMLYIENEYLLLGYEIPKSTPPIEGLKILAKKSTDDTDLINRFSHEYESVVYQNQELTQSISSWRKEWVLFLKRQSLK
ncbi:MAG: DUF3488 and transglutaminase-like domain-containing protein [Pseudobdellovibrio sp.]